MLGVPPRRTENARVDANSAVAWEVCPDGARVARKVGCVKKSAVGACLRADARRVVRFIGDQPGVTRFTFSLAVLILVLALAVAAAAGS